MGYSFISDNLPNLPNLPNTPTHPISRLLPPIFLLTESIFLLTIFLQTRLDLSQIFPQLFSLPIVSDYVRPFIYLSQLLFLLTFTLWLFIYRQSVRVKISSLFQKNLVTRHSYSSLAKSPVSSLQSLSASWRIWLSLALALTLISLLINNPHWWNWFRFINLIGGVVFAIYVYYRLKQDFFFSFLLFLTLGALFQQLLIISQWLNQASIGLQWLGEWRTTVFTPGVAKIILDGQEYLRPHGTFAHPNIAGTILALLWLPGLLVIHHFTTHHSPLTTHRSSLYLIWTLTSLTAILLTFSRLAWFVIFLQILFIIYLYRQKLKDIVISNRLSRFRTANLLVLVLVLVTILTTTPLILPRLTSLTTYDHLSVDRRLQLNHVTIEQIGEHGLFGQGLSNHIISVYQFGPLYGVGLWRQPVHNIYLLSIAEIGLPATLAWLAVCLTSIFHLIRKGFPVARRSSLVTWLLVAWLSVALTGLFDHFWLTIYPDTLAIPALLAATWYLTKNPNYKSQTQTS